MGTGDVHCRHEDGGGELGEVERWHVAGLGEEGLVDVRVAAAVAHEAGNCVICVGEGEDGGDEALLFAGRIAGGGGRGRELEGEVEAEGRDKAGGVEAGTRSGLGGGGVEGMGGRDSAHRLGDGGRIVGS